MGLTPLHESIEFSQVETARFLILCCADPHDRMLSGYYTPAITSSCLELLTRTLIFEDMHGENTKDMLRLIAEENDCDDLYQTCNNAYLGRSLGEGVNLSPEDTMFCFKILQRNVWPPYHEFSLERSFRTGEIGLQMVPIGKLQTYGNVSRTQKKEKAINKHLQCQAVGLMDLMS